jgi:L-fucose isomerase-like protein
MGIYPGTFDHVLMRVKIGPEIEHVDGYTLINMIERVDDAACDEIVRTYAGLASISLEIPEAQIRRSARFYLALQQLAATRNLDAVNLKCQHEFSSDYGMTGCVPLSLLADNGVVASCEGDMLNTVSMMMLHYLSGQVVAYGDAIHHHDNVLKLSACGFLPFSMGKQGDRKIEMFQFDGFKGLHNSFVMRPERVTVMRLVEDIGAYHILYFTGQGLDTELREGILPALDVQLDGDMKKLIAHYAGQHFAICFGDVSDEIENLARILGIKAIRV